MIIMEMCSSLPALSILNAMPLALLGVCGNWGDFKEDSAITGIYNKLVGNFFWNLEASGWGLFRLVLVSLLSIIY